MGPRSAFGTQSPTAKRGVHFYKNRLLKGTPFKTCANPQARDQNNNRANLYENEMVYQSRFLGRGCDEALFSEKKGFSVKSGEAIQ